MFRGSFNPKGCVNFLFVFQYLRRTHHGLGIYQYHKDSLYSHIQRFCFANFVRICYRCWINCGGEVPATKIRIYSREASPKMGGTEAGGKLLER